MTWDELWDRVAELTDQNARLAARVDGLQRELRAAEAQLPPLPTGSCNTPSCRAHAVPPSHYCEVCR